ncbi:hypothetical protein [Actinocorallia libanotica]|uniref:Uncharacterized protein n=1 Tax=Actinocorallia libanotica TaxID=46162 RepID=A0ABN1RLP3_9ACTN
MIEGSGDGEPVDLRSLRADDALLDRLAARGPGPAGEQDAAARLLRALLEDVDAADAPAGPLSAPGAPRPAGSRARARSRATAPERG